MNIHLRQNSPRLKNAVSAGVICAALLAAFAALAWLGVRNRNATYDEPNDSIEAWIITRYADYRISPADPPLAYYWAAIPQSKNALRADFNSPAWRGAAAVIRNEHKFSTDTLFRTSGNDADAFLNRSRIMMLLLGVFVGVALAVWGYRLGGAACSVSALALFCLDPNFLAHAPLVKNDVAMALVAVVMMAVVWLVGRRATAANVLGLGVLCGIALCVKFNGPILGPVVALALLGRAFLPETWIVLGKNIGRFRTKLAVTLLICVTCLLVSYATIWATYRFRFIPSSDSSYHLESRRVARRLVDVERSAAGKPPLSPTEGLNSSPTEIVPRLALFLEDHHLLPEPFTNGLIRNYEGTRARGAFLMDDYSISGWWYYFPLAFLFKTPLATLATLGCAAVFSIWRAIRTKAAAPGSRWRIVCLAIPVIVYGGAAIFGNLNLGIRHLLPIYPFIYLASGLAFAQLWKAHRRAAIVSGLVLVIGLAGETLGAFPNYIPFFNVVAGGSQGGLHLLSDSNLDWGQDLKSLVTWQEKHPNVPLYLCYFGTADPRYYGLNFTDLPGSYASSLTDVPVPQKFPPLSNKGVIAISATVLQGTYLTPESRSFYGLLMKEQPIAVLGGSIYIYALGPESPTR